MPDKEKEKCTDIAELYMQLDEKGKEAISMIAVGMQLQKELEEKKPQEQTA